MRKTAATTAAIIVCASAIVMTSDAAHARRLSFSLGKSASAKPVSAPPAMSRPVAATSTNANSGRGGTFIFVGGGSSSNRPMAAAPRTPVPERGPLHELASVMDQASPMPEPPAEKAVEHKPAPPAVRTTPVFISMAAPAKPVEKPAEKAVAAAPIGKMVYCAVRPNGGCAPF